MIHHLKRGRLAYLIRTSLLSVTMLGVAVALACLVGLQTFPLISGIPGETVIWSIAATALIVAIPIVLMGTVLTARIAFQKLDLAAREELFVTAQQIGKFGYWHYNAATEELTLSVNMHELLGDPNMQQRIDLPKILEMTNPEDRGELAESLRRIIEEGACEDHQYRITGFDGVEKTLWVDGKRMAGRAGSANQAYGACRDITEQVATEAALRESEDHYRHAVELSPQIPWTADPQGNVLEIGSRWYDLTGSGCEEVLGTAWSKAVHPEDSDRALRVRSIAMETGEPYDVEYRLHLADNSCRWFRARAAARRDDRGDIICWYGTLEDIHDRKMAEAALRESEALARSVVESSPDCVKILDLQGNLQFMNGPGLQALEIADFGAFKGRQWAAYWPGSTRELVEQAMAAARGGTVARFSGYCPTAKGSARWWDVWVSPILMPDGKPDRLLATSRDVTAAKRTQDELEQARREAETAAQRLENVLSSTRDCVITFDRQLRVVYLNKRAQEVIAGGLDIVGMTPEEAFPELVSTPFDEHFRKAVSRWEPVRSEGYFAPYDRWLDCHICPAADGISVFFRDVSDRQRAQEQLLYLAHHDTLTGLLNRTVLRERLGRSLATATPERQTALLFLDLDEFKAVNDALGHAAGDQLLVQVGKRLAACVRDGDVVARFGGDEFAVMTEVSGAKEAAGLAERIIEALSRPYKLDGRSASVGVSIGVVMASDTTVSADHALRNADIALYQAKAAGRGVHKVFQAEMGEEFEEREALKHDLRHALQRDELEIEYQPLVSLGENCVTGFEALLRWKHATRGLVMPSVFIPIAEETGLIVEIGEWVLGRACREAATWPGGMSVAVNLSPVQFSTGDLVQTVARSLAESGLAGERLQLEITESVLLADCPASLEALHALRRLGAAIAMDDFGTGYSSLSYLRSFPFDKIKIDRAFVSDLSAEGGSEEPNAIVRAIIDLAQSLRITTTAEGIETRSQLRALGAMGCSEGQGYLFSRSVGAEEVARCIMRLNEEMMSLTPAPLAAPMNTRRA